jgi:hypothetical protein
MKNFLTGILVASLIAAFVPQFAVAAGYRHASQVDRASTSKKEQLRRQNAAAARTPHTPSAWGSGYGGGEARPTPVGH